MRKRGPECAPDLARRCRLLLHWHITPVTVLHPPGECQYINTGFLCAAAALFRRFGIARRGGLAYDRSGIWRGERMKTSMELQAVWFDLDGTLLPMDQDAFVRAYFSLLARWAAPRGYEPGKLADTVWQGTAAMIHNDGRRANEAVFWQAFVDAYGETALADRPFFDAFYREAFQRARTACGFAPQASQAVRLVRDKGFRAVLALSLIHI